MGEVCEDRGKLTFMDGEKLPNSTGGFNTSLYGGARRAIDLREREMVDAGASVAMAGRP